MLREWDRTGAPLAALAETLDEAYARALAEVNRPKPPRLSGAARLRLAKLAEPTRGETVEAENDALSPEDAEAVRRWRLACGAEPLSPEDEAAMTATARKDTKPGRYGSDAAMDAAVAAFERLTGKRATRINSERVRPGTRTHSETVRRGGALTFARALDGFYGLSLATDTRMAEAISRATAGRTRRSAYGGAE